MKAYDSLKGVPRFCYYLEEIITFGDLGVKEEKRISLTSKDKKELVEYCRANNYACPDCDDNGNSKECYGWYTHYIRYRGI
jgi:hypothetical protein